VSYLDGGRDHMSYGLPWANASNTPFRLYKHWVHEGGISTPLIVSWPAVVRKGGGLTAQPGHLIDLMAACVDVAGVAQESQGQRDHSAGGQESAAHLSRQDSRATRSALLGARGQSRRSPGKVEVVSLGGGDWELYDLDSDRRELHNLAKTMPTKVKELSGKYDAWAKRCQGGALAERLGQIVSRRHRGNR